MEPSDSPPAPNAATPGRSVLCIEDEEFISGLYDRALTKAGYQVEVIDDGAKALAAAQSGKYDIILLDLMIPSLPGIEILRTLRDPAKTPQLRSKIIVSTNLDQGEEVREEIEKQADGYVVKAEITPHELVDLLNTIK